MIANAAARAVRQYGKMSVVSAVESAGPHRLIQMLLDGALARIARAKGNLRRGEVARKGEAIGLAISIVEGLRASINHEVGGEIASNLDALYEYCVRRLLAANLDNDESALDEVTTLLSEVKAAWDAIRPVSAPTQPRAVTDRAAGSAA